MELTDLHERFINLSKPLEPIETDTVPRLQAVDNIRVIAYDFYGTLFISGAGDIGIDDGNKNAELLIETFENSGIEIRDESAGSKGLNTYNEVVDKQIQNLKKNGMEYPEPDIREVWKNVLEKLSDQGLIQYPKENSVPEIVSVEFEAKMNPVWPMADTVDILEHFKQQGFIQGIISNSQFYTPVVLEALTNYSLDDLGFEGKLLHWSFEESLKKPDLNLYKGFLEKLKKFDEDLAPENVLYVGNDMLKDIYPAYELGMKTVLFAGDQRSLKWRKDDERCKNILPDVVITSLSQLKSCVKP